MTKTESCIVSLDAEIAFDSVRWLFLYKALSKFGFHEKCIRTIQLLYDTPSARIKVNGDLSDLFTLNGVAIKVVQFCPPLLFIYRNPRTSNK